MQFKLYDKEFEITDSMLAAGRFLVKNVIPLAESATKKIGNAYDEYGNLENAATQLFNFKEKIYENTAKYYVTLLHEQDLRDYDYQVEDFMNDCRASFGGMYIDELCEMLEKYYDILAKNKTAAEYQRELRKATRGRFYGANLGSSAVAGSLNLFSGAVHSIFNAIDGAITNSEIDDKMDAVYKECEDAVWYCVFGDTYNMGILFFSIANLDNFYIENENRARKIKKAIDEGQVPKNKLSEKVAQVLYLMPQYEENYIWAFKLLGDDYFKLTDYAELFEQKAAVKEIQSAMAEIEIQKKKKQQELKLKAEKVAADKTRQEELNRAAVSIFGKDSDQMQEKYSGNKFYSIFLDNPNANFDEFCKKICNSFEKFSKYTKYIWSRDKYHFDGKLNELKENFDKFKVTPPNNSDVSILVACDEYFKTILFDSQKIYFVSISEKPRSFFYNEIKNFKFVRKEGVMTYSDYINVNGEDLMTVEFDDEVFKAVKDIIEIFKLKNSMKNSSNTAEIENKPQISFSEFKANLRDNYKFNTYVYYNYANDEKAQKKFKAAFDSYANLSADEEPFVLFDATLFGSAKDGFILTNKGFHSKGIGIEQKFIPYDRLGIAQDSKGKHQIIKINAIEIDTVALKDEDIEKLVKLMRKCREYFTSQKNSASPKVETTKNLPVETGTSTNWEDWADEKNPTVKSPVKVETLVKEISDEDIKNFVQQLQAKYNFRSHIYFSGNDKKSDKKFKAALKSYAKLSQNEVEVVCCDSTVFGGGDEGFLITNKGVHSKSVWNEYSFISYVENNLLVSQNEKRIVLNGVVEIDTGFFSTEEKQSLINLINECKNFFG